MASLKKTYFLVRHEKYPPNTDIVLGNIIEDPFAPQSSLNAGAIVPVPASALRSSTENDWKGVKGKKRGGSIGIYASFLSSLGVGGDLDVGRETGLTHTYEFERLETEFFEPSTEYLLKSIYVPNVRQFVDDTDFERELYMIIGTKVAYGAKIGSQSSKKHDLNVKIGISAAAAGVPIEAGPKGSLSQEDTDDISFGSCSPFVFAYRLRRIQYSKRKNALTQKDFTKGAAYSLDDEGKAVIPIDAEGGVGIQVSGVDGEDLGGGDFDIKGQEAFDEDDEAACEIIQPPADE